MTDTIGEVHGIIDRVEAWERWRPYGERCELETPVTAEVMAQDLESIVDTVAFTDVNRQYDAYQFFKNPESKNTDWLDDLREYVREHGFDGSFAEVVMDAHQADTSHAAELRQVERENALHYISLFRTAVAGLYVEDYFSALQAESILKRCIAPDETPFFELTPMTYPHARQLNKELYVAGTVSRPSACMDYTNGAIWLPVGGGGSPKFAHNRVHELVHANVEGAEIFDITRDDGARIVSATTVGCSAEDPSTSITPVGVYDAVRDIELAEGWTDFTARELMRRDQKLGVPVDFSESGYRFWVFQMQALQANQKVFKAIIDAAVIEADRQRPDAKKEAIERMHAIADSEFGYAGSLTKMMTKEVRIHDVHRKQ